MSSLFHEMLIRPLFNVLIFLYETVAFNDLGIAIILLTIIIRLILYPLFYKVYKNQTLLQKIQPEIKKIQHTHKSNREKQAQELLALYRHHKVNPFSGIFLIIIQIPILIALYRVFLQGFSPELLKELYSFVPSPDAISSKFLNLIDLANPNIIIVGLAAAAQYFQGRLSLPKTKKSDNAGMLGAAEKLGKQMIFIGPAITLVIFYSLPAAIEIYWLTTSVFSLLQQLLINKKLMANGYLREQSQTNT